MKRQHYVIIAVVALLAVVITIVVFYGEKLFGVTRQDTSYTHITLQDLPELPEDPVERLDALQRDIQYDYVLIGDSRTVGLDLATRISSNKKINVVAKSAMGHNWLVKEALPEAARLQKDRYVMLLGANDLVLIDRYIETYTKLIEEGKKLWIVTVGPVREGVGGYTIQNAEIEAFNARLSEVEGAKLLDLYGYLVRNGFEAPDGVHYSDDTYYMMLEFLLERLE
ncbi:MAG: hypothetical protein IK016_08540 [Lachnospiraceae bacterium]|nr:hypothetical protein [Lachnospiraceae bacterium]